MIVKDTLKYENSEDVCYPKTSIDQVEDSGITVNEGGYKVIGADMSKYKGLIIEFGNNYELVIDNNGIEVRYLTNPDAGYSDYVYKSIFIANVYNTEMFVSDNKENGFNGSAFWATDGDTLVSLNRIGRAENDNVAILRGCQDATNWVVELYDTDGNTRERIIPNNDLVFYDRFKELFYLRPLYNHNITVFANNIEFSFNITRRKNTSLDLSEITNQHFHTICSGKYNNNQVYKITDSTLTYFDNNMSTVEVDWPTISIDRIEDEVTPILGATDNIM